MDYTIIKKPLISEKSFQEAALGKFTFIVDKKASKEEVAETISGLFNVDVLAVNSANFEGKIKRTKKGLGKRGDFKKAVVTLKKGQKIDLFEVEKEEKGGKQKTEAKKDEKVDKDTTVKVRERKK